MTDKQKYRNKCVGNPLLSTISCGCKTPIMEVKFSNLIKPFYYPNSQVPRHSITCMLIHDNPEHIEFIKGVQAIEKNEGVETIIKIATVKEDGKHYQTEDRLIKFQTKETIPVYIFKKNKEHELIELEDELGQGEKVSVIYDILRYTKRNTTNLEHGLSFKPTCIYYHPQE